MSLAASSLLVRPLDAFLADALEVDGMGVDFLTPAGEASLTPAEGVSWRVFANPVTVFVGGVAAVILELAEPRVRTGVWEFTTFRTDPVARMRRTGLAAMATIYAARSRAEAVIARVNRMHAKIAGVTPAGEAFRANDPDLLAWVQATAAFGFLEAYCTYAGPLSRSEADAFYAEGRAGAQAYGVVDPPKDAAACAALFSDMTPRLEASPVVEEFLGIVSHAPVMPAAGRGVQRMLVKAAVELVPQAIQVRIGLARPWRLSAAERWMTRRLARLAEGLQLPSHPRTLARRRLGLEGRAR